MHTVYNVIHVVYRGIVVLQFYPQNNLVVPNFKFKYFSGNMELLMHTFHVYSTTRIIGKTANSFSKVKLK